MEHTTATSLLSLEFQAFCTFVRTRIFKFPEIVKKYALLVYFWEPSGPSRARMRTNTDVHLALPSAKPSLPRGLLRGEPPNVPKNRQRFFKKFPSLSFSYTWKKMDARHKHYGTGPAESWGHLRLRDTAPPSPPYTYVAYERELPRRCLSKSRTKNTEIK